MLTRSFVALDQARAYSVYLLYWYKSTNTDAGAAEQAVVLVNASINSQETATHLRKGAGPNKPLPPGKKKAKAVVRSAPVAPRPAEAASEAEEEAQALATAQARTNIGREL